MFYLTDPAETSFPDMDSLPTSYTAQATPFFAGMIVLEWAILLLRGEKLRLILELSCLGFCSPAIFTSTRPSVFMSCLGTILPPGSVLPLALTFATTGYTGQLMVGLGTFISDLLIFMFQK